MTSAVDLASRLKFRMTLLHVMQMTLLDARPAMEAGVALAAYLEQLKSDLDSAFEACAQRVG